LTNKLRLIFWQAFKKPKHATSQPPKAKAIKSDATLLITNSKSEPKPKPKSKQARLEKIEPNLLYRIRVTVSP